VLGEFLGSIRQQQVELTHSSKTAASAFCSKVSLNPLALSNGQVSGVSEAHMLQALVAPTRFTGTQ
jgi:hypothetical protein